MTLLANFQKNSNSLSKLEIDCFNKLLVCDNLDPNFTIASIAVYLMVSTTTIFRMVKKLGYGTFMEFRYDLLYRRRKTVENSITVDSNTIDQIEKQITDTLDILKSIDVKVLVKAITNANSVLIYSSGMNNYIAKILAIKLSLMGIRTNYPEDQWFMFLEANNLKKDDLVIVFSREGNTPQLLDVVKNVKMTGNKVMLITETKYSKMQKLSDYVVNVSFGDNEGYDIDSRLSMHIAIEFIMKELVKIIK